jgi:hypothetical protein
MHTKFLSGNLKGSNSFGDIGVGGRMILKWVCETGVGGMMMLKWVCDIGVGGRMILKWIC